MAQRLRPHPQPLGARSVGWADGEAFSPSCRDQLVQDVAFPLPCPATHCNHAQGRVHSAQNIQCFVAYLKLVCACIEADQRQRPAAHYSVLSLLRI